MRPSIRTAARTSIGAAALALALGPVLAPAAHADDVRLDLSRDGVHWHDGLARPLFSPKIRWVPGDVRVSRFYIRNLSVDPGLVSVSVVREQPDQELVDTDAMVIEARTGTGPWRTVETGSDESLVDLDQVATHRITSVDIRARMHDGAPNLSMRLAADLALRVTLRDAIPGDELPDRDLPGTGADVPPWLPPFALAVLGSGIYLVRRRGRDDDEPDDVRDGRDQALISS